MQTCPVSHRLSSHQWASCSRHCSQAAVPKLLKTRCKVASKEVYQGKFGPWTIEPEDVTEVWAYRVGITVATTAFVVGSVPALLPDGLGSAALQALEPALNPLTLMGAGGLGASLFLIHIYMDPLKKALQALWFAGLCGTLYLMASHDTPTALYVVQHPWAVWLVGPMFAAVTGVAFKEGLCYGKPEAAALFLVTPLLMLGHLTGWVPELGQRGLLAAMVVIMTVFAARKYTQPIKDDIGDKSIFMFLKSPPEEQQRILARVDGQMRDEE